MSGAQLYRLVDCSVLSYLVLLSFGETFWIQSVQFEVFTLNNLFVCITLFLTVRFFYLYWQEDVSKCISLFLCSNSVPSCSLGRFSRRFVTLQPAYDRFYLFPIIMSVLYILNKTHQLSVNRFFQLAFLFILGLLPYSYLVITSYFPKKASWGDARTFSGDTSSLFLCRVAESSSSFGIRYVPSVCWG